MNSSEEKQNARSKSVNGFYNSVSGTGVDAREFLKFYI